MRRNVAARAGHWSAAHWKTATVGWIAFVVAAVVLGGAIGTKQVEDDDSPGESGRMSRILEESFGQPAEETVLVQSDTLTAGDRAFAAAVDDVVRGISATGVVADLRSPLDPANAAQISEDRQAALLTFVIRGDPDEAADKIEPVIATVDDAQEANPDLFIGGIGDATIDKEIGDAVGKDLERAGLLSVPITLTVLIVAFGSLVAAGIPLLLALSAVVATMGLLAIPSQIWPVDESVGAVVRSIQQQFLVEKRPASGRRTGYGLGFEVADTQLGRFVRHTGNVVGGTAFALAHTESRAAIAMTTNVGWVTVRRPPKLGRAVPDPPQILIPFVMAARRR